MRTLVLILCALLVAALAACAAVPLQLDATRRAQLDAVLPADILLLGEQHDAPEHHRLEQDVVQELARRGMLAALVLEMAEQGHSTTGLPADASAARVREALDWDGAGWPWRAYGPAIMAAVRAGVPVHGGNLPRVRMRSAMRDEALDGRLPAAALATQRERIREGHCHMLPEAQIAPMARIQVARDQALAEAALQQRQPGRTVLVIAGNGHVDRALGVPQHLPGPTRVAVIAMRAGAASADEPAIAADWVWHTPAIPPRDYCAALRAHPVVR